MAIITNSIGSAGRDYSTLAGWAAALPADIVSSGNSYVGECYNDTAFTSGSSFLTLAGHTTDSGHTITLKCAAGQSFRDNSGVRGNALRFDAGNGVSFSTNVSADAAILCDDAFVTFDGLQIVNTGTFGSKALQLTAAAHPTTITNCILDSSNPSNFVHELIGGGDRVNTVIINRSNTASQPSVLAYKTANYYFCTIVSPGDLAPAIAALDGGGFGETKLFENCAFFGCSAVSQNMDGVQPVFVSCMTDVGSPPTGCTTVVYASQFRVVTDALSDFRIKAGANLIDAGTADPTNGATDISGLARPQGGGYDIGAWELEQIAAVLMGARTM